MTIYIPAHKAEDWKQFLADPEKQWKMGYSARSLAHCWQNAGGLPSDVISVLNQIPSLLNIETILAFPEHKVPLPGGSRPSQNDVWVLGKSSEKLISIAVEGKVSEPFGESVKDWFKNKSRGKTVRLQYLCNELGIAFPPPNEIRYQLLHRTVSAIIEAKKFNTKEAVMVVHTFSESNEWFDDYSYFLSLFDLEGEINKTVFTKLKSGINLYFAWVHGNSKYLNI